MKENCEEVPHGKKRNADSIVPRSPCSRRGGRRDWSPGDSPGILHTKERSLSRPRKNLEFPNPNVCFRLNP